MVRGEGTDDINKIYINTMQELTRDRINVVIQSNKSAIKNPNAKIALGRNHSLLSDRQEVNKDQIKKTLLVRRDQHSELLPFVKKIKLHIGDITESTHVCAIYILLCHIFENWNSLFILAEQGKNSAVANLLRMIKEGVAMVELFTMEFAKGESTNLDKWFSGEIIGQEICRKMAGEFAKEYSPCQEVNVKELDAHIYQMESQASHNSYLSVLELVSPFTEDFDFDGYTGFVRTCAWIKYGSLASTNIALKLVYQLLTRDKKDLERLDKILIKYNPEMNGEIDKESLKDFIK